MNSRTSSLSISMFTFMTGFALGAGAGLLLAPQSGARTRRHLQHLAHDLQDRAEDLVDEVQQVVSTALEKDGG
ncbi:MAG: YtxH domain-containing protein [Nitrospira sp.]